MVVERNSIVERLSPAHYFWMDQRLFTFVAGSCGTWKIDKMESVVGPKLPAATHLEVCAGALERDGSEHWALSGVGAGEGYLGLIGSRAPFEEMSLHPRRSQAAFLAVRKSADWWALTPRDRERVLEEQGMYVRNHVAGLSRLSIQLCNCRGLPSNEPFDCLTWFEYDASHALAVNDLIESLRHTRERDFVVWEVELRLVRAAVTGGIGRA